MRRPSRRARLDDLFWIEDLASTMRLVGFRCSNDLFCNRRIGFMDDDVFAAGIATSTSVSAGIVATIASSAGVGTAGIATTTGIAAHIDQRSATSIAIPGPTAAASTAIAAIAPQARDTVKDAAALSAGLAVMVSTTIAWIADIRWMIDPWIKVQFAAAFAVTTSLARMPECKRTVGCGTTCHGTDTAAEAG